MKLYIFLFTFVVFISSCNYANCQIKKYTPSLSLSERYNQLTMKKPILKLNTATFKEFVKATPKNYSFVIMFTAMAPSRNCFYCGHAYDEFLILVDSYRHSQAFSNKLFFGIIDFDEGSEVFQMMRLNTAPVYMHFPAKGKPKSADTMDIQRVGFTADAIAKWIYERTDVQIRIIRPPNYFGTLAVLVLFILIGGFLYLRRNNLDFLYNKTIWGLGAMFFTLTMISGQMWNHIRGPPLIHKTSSGSIACIHSSSQGQFVLESYIVLVLNGAVLLGMILMTEAASRKSDMKKRRVFAVIGLGLVAVFFSLLLSIFRNKAQAYPYSLLFK